MQLMPSIELLWTKLLIRIKNNYFNHQSYAPQHKSIRIFFELTYVQTKTIGDFEKVERKSTEHFLIIYNITFEILEISVYSIL